MPALPSVSVVITTYARRDGLEPVVAAALADPHASEVVVVVDGCDDGSYELLKTMAVADSRVHPVWRGNGGAAAARATGVEQAGGDVVLLLDDDVVADAGLAEGHARAHSAHTGLVVVGYLSTVLPSARQPGDVASFLYAEDYERACERYERDTSSILPHLWAGNMSIRRTDALRIGLSGGLRLERHNDQDFGLRCARAGLTGVFDRSLRARHVHARDPSRFGRQARQAGAARRSLEQAYPDLLPSMDPGAQLNLGQRLAVDIAVPPLLRILLHRAGQARLWTVETGLARLLRQVELRRGYRGATR